MKGHEEEWEVLVARAAGEQNPGKLLKLINRINQLLDQKRSRLLGKPFPGEARRGKRVFQIAYDEMLLISRAEILEQRGYEVISVLGNEDARTVLTRGGQYRIFLIGHAAPKAEREEMVRWVKATFPGAKVVALNPKKNGGPIPDADFNFVINGPEGWLAAISNEAA